MSRSEAKEINNPVLYPSPEGFQVGNSAIELLRKINRVLAVVETTEPLPFLSDLLPSEALLRRSENEQGDLTLQYWNSETKCLTTVTGKLGIDEVDCWVEEFDDTQEPLSLKKFGVHITKPEISTFEPIEDLATFEQLLGQIEAQLNNMLAFSTELDSSKAAA